MNPLTHFLKKLYPETFGQPDGQLVNAQPKSMNLPTDSPVHPQSLQEAARYMMDRGWNTKPNTTAQAATPSPIAQAQQLAPQATPIGIPEDKLRQNISQTWGEDTPLLQQLALFMQAGNKLPGNMEKLLPIALALRETQGGQDNMQPGAKTGQNNYFNISNGQGWQDYPDMQTALMGNLDQGGESGGLGGLLSGSKPESKGIYEDFRRTNDYHDLFNHWSPEFDKNGKRANGPMDGPGGQIANINWILNQLKK